MLRKIGKRIASSWLFELILVAFIGGAALLYIYRADIVPFLEETTEWLLNQAPTVIQTTVNDLISKITLKWVAIVIGSISMFLLVVWRVFWRLRKSKALTKHTCPRCSHPLVRIHRKPWQRVLSKVLPIRRFYCRKCNWRGVRFKTVHKEPLDVQQSTEVPVFQIDKIEEH